MQMRNNIIVYVLCWSATAVFTASVVPSFYWESTIEFLFRSSRQFSRHMHVATVCLWVCTHATLVSSYPGSSYLVWGVPMAPIVHHRGTINFLGLAILYIWLLCLPFLTVCIKLRFNAKVVFFSTAVSLLVNRRYKVLVIFIWIIINEFSYINFVHFSKLNFLKGVESVFEIFIFIESKK